MDDNKFVFNTQEAADLLGVSLRRVQAMIKQGHFRSFRCTCGLGWVLNADDVRAYKRKRDFIKKKKEGK